MDLILEPCSSESAQNQQHQPGAPMGGRISGPTPDMLSQHLRLTRSPGSSWVHSSTGSTGLEQWFLLVPWLPGTLSFFFNLYLDAAGLSCSTWELLLQRDLGNLRYADDTTLRAERKEELKSVLLKVKESKKVT